MSSLDPFRMIGKTLAGHFLVQSLVGEGRSSIVYKGLHIGPKKPVALKCYKLGSWLDSASAAQPPADWPTTITLSGTISFCSVM